MEKHRSDTDWDQFNDETMDDVQEISLIGDWIKDEEGLYMPDFNGEYAAIVRESVVQVVYSKYVTKVYSLCSPCYPGQADVVQGNDVENGRFLAYNLPKEAYEY